MSRNQTDPLLKKPARKFLFDAHDFDDHHKKEEPEENLPPPPPMFTEQELERARREALQQGRREAQTEADNSRERKVADLLTTISREFSTLFAAEDLRNSQYEAEAVRLTLATFQRLFPALNQKNGFDEVQRIISEVLENHREQPSIKLEVYPDYVESIQDYVSRILKQGNMPGNCQVLGNNALGPGDCRMAWENGGALRDTESLSEDIERHMQHILADRPRLRDNRRSDISMEKPSHVPAPEPAQDPSVTQTVNPQGE